jgi:hypothetical protein
VSEAQKLLALHEDNMMDQVLRMYLIIAECNVNNEIHLYKKIYGKINRALQREYGK